MTTDKENLEPYTKWYNFINSFPKNTPVYLATDNVDTQNIFIKKYPNILYWKKIEHNNNLRKTSLVDAVILINF